MSSFDKYFIAIFEFVMNPKKYLEDKIFFKNSNELVYKEQEFKKDYENLNKYINDEESNSFCTNGHKYNNRMDFCVECYLNEQKQEIEKLKQKSKYEKIKYRTFWFLIFIAIVLYFVV